MSGEDKHEDATSGDRLSVDFHCLIVRSRERDVKKIINERSRLFDEASPKV